MGKNETEGYEKAACIVNEIVELDDLIHNELARVKAVLDILEHGRMEQLETDTVPALSFMMEGSINLVCEYVKRLTGYEPISGRAGHSGPVIPGRDTPERTHETKKNSKRV